MRLLILLSFCMLIGCSSDQSTLPLIPVAQPTPSFSPTPEKFPLLKAVVPNLRMNSKQTKYLDSSLPPEVRKILENSDVFEILAEVGVSNRSETALQTLEPNRIVRVVDENLKKRILEAFYSDASNEDGASSCYEPHHAIHAIYQGNNVDIEICFSCSRFYVKGTLGEFSGTIVRDHRKSEKLFERIVKEKSVELK